MKQSITTYQNYDSAGMFKNIYNFPEQLQHASHIGQQLILNNTYGSIQNIIFAGMGGSAIAGDLVALLAAKYCSLPMVVVRNYALAHWINTNSLIICLSYSGETEETLSVFHEARKRNTPIIGITAGGTLHALLQEHHLDSITIPAGLPPRSALGYLSIPILHALHKLGLVPATVFDTLPEALDILIRNRQTWSEESPTNHAYAIAQEIYQTIPIIYGEARKTSTIARRWRAQFGENSKMLASSNEFPELNHNEIVGWDKNPDLLQKTSVIWLTDPTISERNKKRIDISYEIIGEKTKKQFILQGEGTSYTSRMLSLIYLGDWVSFWCAILHKEDPTPVETIKRIKKYLQEHT